MTNTYRKLYRSQTDRFIAGVCGGLGEYFEIDPIIFRALFILLIFPGGLGLFVYILMAIFVPKNPEDEKPAMANLGEKVQNLAKEVKDAATKQHWFENRRNLLGLIVIIIGFMILMNQFFPQPWMGGRFLLALAIIIVGLVIILKKSSRKHD